MSIEKSEVLSELLKKKKIPHAVLNARYHEQEAQIISQAGRPGAVTIATNMAGRGTDIQLGGNLDMRLAVELANVEDPAERERITAQIRAEIERDKEIVKQAGGLFVIGTERHESRASTTSLRPFRPSGRRRRLQVLPQPGRRPDADLRVRADGRHAPAAGLKEGEAIVHSWINKALEKAQQKVEAHNFDIRKICSNTTT